MRSLKRATVTSAATVGAVVAVCALALAASADVEAGASAEARPLDGLGPSNDLSIGAEASVSTDEGATVRASAGGDGLLDVGTGPPSADAPEDGPVGPAPWDNADRAEVAVSAGVLGSLLAGATFWRFGLPGLLAPLYSLISDDELLEQETRRELMEAIRGDPGLSLKELADLCGAGWGATTYHLQRLEQAGLVRSEKQRRRRRFYPVGEIDRDQTAALGLLRDATPAAIAEYLVRTGEASQSQIADGVEVANSTAHKHLSRMEDEGLVEAHREGRSKQYRPAAKLGEVQALLSS